MRKMTTNFPVHTNRPNRRLDVAQRAKYSLYKSDLRLDFYKSCGYCGTSDFYSGGQTGFHIDHFAPKSKFDGLKNSYHNLVYSCPICNIGKSNDWPGSDPKVSFVGSVGYVDPCCNTYDHHLSRDASGRIVPLTPLGEYIYNKMKLYLKRRQICWLVDKMETQLNSLRIIIENNPDDSEKLQMFFDLTVQYLRYTGLLKCE